MPVFFKTVVVALNALLLLNLLKAVLPSVWSQPSFISLFTLLLMVAPFETTILYAVSVRKFLVWFISLGANLLIAVLVAGFTLFLGNISIPRQHQRRSQQFVWGHTNYALGLYRCP